MSWGIFLVALLFRGAYLAWAGGRVWFEVPAVDAQIFDGWARSILAGDLVGRHLFLLNPGYAYVLAFLYGIAGPGPWVPAIAQALAGAATAVLIARIAESCRPAVADGGRAAGWSAGLLYALTACLPFYEAQRLSAAWLNLANAAGLYWMLLPGRPAGFKAGLAFGVSAWFRPNVLPVALLAACGPAWQRRSAGPIVGVALGLVAALAPLAIRNLVVSHEFVLTTVAGGIVFYKGNAPGPGLYTVPSFSSNNPVVEAAEFRAEASRRAAAGEATRAGEPLSAAGTSRFWTAETWRAVRADPPGWAARMGRKAVALVHADEPSTNLDYDTFSRGAPTRMSPVTFGSLWVLAVLGMIWAWRTPTVRALAAYVAAYSVALLLFIVAPEYRLPLAPALAVLAGLGLVEAPRRWASTAGSGRALLFGGAGLALLALHRPAFAPREAQARVMLGRMYFDRGQPADAIKEWDAAVRMGVSKEAIEPWRAAAEAALARVISGGGPAPAWPARRRSSD